MTDERRESGAASGPEGARVTPQMLEAYLDGMLPDAERAAVERLIEGDAEARAAVELQAGIDGAVRRAFARGEGVAVELANAEAGAEQSLAKIGPDKRATGRMTWRRRIAVAAIFALGVFGAWNTYRTLFPPKPDGGTYVEQPWRDFETVYGDVVKAGFAPDWVCKDDREFATAVYAQLGQGLLLRSLPEGVAALGWTYSNTVTPETMCLLARVEGEPVVVFVDRSKADRLGAPTMKREDLHVFQSHVGDLVLYELSPLAEARVLPEMYEPEMPAEWIKDAGARRGGGQ